MDCFALEAPECVVLYVGSVYRHDSTGKQSPIDKKTIISLMQYIKVYTIMPVWYIAVYAGTSRYENLIPGYTGIYRDVRNRMVLSRWSGFQMWDSRCSSCPNRVEIPNRLVSSCEEIKAISQTRTTRRGLDAQLTDLEPRSLSLGVPARATWAAARARKLEVWIRAGP